MMMFNESGALVGIVHNTEAGAHDAMFTAPKSVSVTYAVDPVLVPVANGAVDSVLVALKRRFGAVHHQVVRVAATGGAR